MARTFITSGEGSQQTLSDIQNEKIPIYDSEQDAESDLANLEEGQIVGTKEGKFDIDDMKQYIRNQNVLSDWEDVTISTDSANPTPMQYDGFITITSQDGSSHQVGAGVQLYVNDVEIQYQGWMTNQDLGLGYTAIIQGVCVPVKKGDNIYATISGGTTVAFKTKKGCFYKLRDYSDR